jgi:hypothetical protein
MKRRSRPDAQLDSIDVPVKGPVSCPINLQYTFLMPDVR